MTKKIIKQLIPPIIANLFRKTPSKNLTYEGIFQSFSEVKNSKKYNVDILQDHLFDLTNTNLEAYKLSNPLPNINFRSPVSNLFSLLRNRSMLAASVCSDRNLPQHHLHCFCSR